MGRSDAVHHGLDKLQALLLAMEPGDEVSVVQAREVSGLDEPMCHTVFVALMRAGLMMRLQHAYVRVRLDETEQRFAQHPYNSA